MKKKLDMGGGPFKNAEGGGSKNYQCQFQILDPPQKNTHTNNLGGIKKFLDTPQNAH